MTISTTFLGFLMLSAAGASHSQMQDAFNLPEPHNNNVEALGLWATYYHVHFARLVPDGVLLRDRRGSILAGPITARDWCQAAIQGTVSVVSNDSSVMLNVGGLSAESAVDCAASITINADKNSWIKSSGRTYFARSRGPFGDGVAGYKLVPFRTIAVDKSRIPYGTVLFIPRARGATIMLPSGREVPHDGYFFAADRGVGVHGNHIDIFCGTVKANCFPGVAEGDPSKIVEAFVVSDPQIHDALEALHR